MKIEIYDTTLRDGLQGCGVDFSVEDKLTVLHTLDRLGVTYIEVGMLTDSASAEYCARIAAEKLTAATPVVFGQTCRPGEACRDNAALCAIAACSLPAAAIFGKSFNEPYRLLWSAKMFCKEAETRKYCCFKRNDFPST